MNLITGAFGYTGKYIAQKLLEKGEKIRTLTAHPNIDSPVYNKIEIFNYNFNDPENLLKAFQGVKVFYNTYWVRFSYREVSYELGYKNSLKLIDFAKKAGVKRIIHISITNPSLNSPFPYFKYKALIENTIINSGLSYAILRPALIFGTEDILINNIAWLLRKFPIFVIPGKGDYKVQPVFVEDLADIAIACAEKNENLILDTAGPECFSFNEMVTLIAEKIRKRRIIIHLNPELFFFLTKILNLLVSDIILTKDEIYGLTAGLLVPAEPVKTEMERAKTSFSEWLEKNKDSLGVQYRSELKRHFNKI